MTSRFDNLPTDELLRLELQTHIDRDALVSLIRDRFYAETDLVIGKAYRVTSGRFQGRRIWLQYIVPATHFTIRRLGGELYAVAEGVLDKGTRWNIKHVRTAVGNLDKSSEHEP